ncbi:MAG: UDP-N-acetylglucosamine 2-epimerase (non-hydrolyzing) [Deltaproteobacteria bacterium]|nr:UDP-N-acetylglucosamine 2-epimerase (non-hydrolyzing) [Deltaproteobacteria bacterium]
MLPVVYAVGARPNFVKVAALIAAHRRLARDLPFRLVHTGQHYDAKLSLVHWSDLQLPKPDADLAVGSGSNAWQLARTVERFADYLERHPARGVVVVGDVNATLGCALAADRAGVALAHVEAGLRSFDRRMTEEKNRILTDHLADLLFVSEPSGERNLRAEGIKAARIFYVGNVMIDSLCSHLGRARQRDCRRTLGLADGDFGLVTLHRAENVDDIARLRRLVDLVLTASKQAKLHWPLHPRVERRLDAVGLLSRLNGIQALTLGPALGYLDFLSLLDSCSFVLTDSGGVAEEATFLGKPCLTLRPTTDRPATVETGYNHIVDDDTALALEVLSVCRSAHDRGRCEISGWDGHAAERVIDQLLRLWVREGLSSSV